MKPTRSIGFLLLSLRLYLPSKLESLLVFSPSITDLVLLVLRILKQDLGELVDSIELVKL